MNADVSVVIPCYNSSPTISYCLNSVASQSLMVFEVIVVDDGSDDVGYIKLIVDEFKNRLNIVLLMVGKNCGPAHARNIGLKAASAKYIAFLDSDDVWHCDKIAIQYKYMIENNLHITGHGYVFDLNKEEMTVDVGGDQVGINKISFVTGNKFFTPTVMVERENFVLFDERLVRMEDYKCWVDNLHQNRNSLLPCKLAGGFKRGVGESGLSGSIRKMHTSYVRALFYLYVEKKVSVFFLFLALVVEYMKYPARFILARLRA